MFTGPFLLLILNGSWRPNKWNSKVLIRLYDFYTIIAYTIFYTFVATLVIGVIVAENSQLAIELMIQLLNEINVSWKNFTFKLKRKKVIRFMNLFFDGLTLPQTPQEENIQQKFDSESRNNTWKLGVIYSISVITYVYMPFFISDIENRVLVTDSWLPYSLDNVNYYYGTYLHQAVAVTIAALGNGATEVLVSGFMIQICAQFEILEERFRQLPQTLNKMKENHESESIILSAEKILMIRLIKHHLRIFEMAKTLNDIYVFVIFFQFVSSIFVLCVCTYTLAVLKTVNSAFITVLLFLSCMLLQIFLYTWYGNEITLRSVDLGSNILLCDWRSLSCRGIKDLMFIYERTKKPILLSSGYVITLSNVAFTSIVKTSYSVFNVLSA
ncbi:odorant receptor 4-like [Phymastichus coffea]|uniref:odorant receptor 4-like n=1 Tax=Phymastichus coffea TaxID=108790 RepID=UPI00273BB6FE|nr:odorant receptor 4-like [Phymastichus coffea]